LIQQQTHFYIRDLYDHIVQVADTLENYRELTSSLLEIYLSSVSNRMNEIMKVLTIIATIFIPVTFIAGVYGMNFEYMPELKWKWGYAMVWGVMISMIVVMVGYFRKKKWL
jgi:magnesium transporter